MPGCEYVGFEKEDGTLYIEVHHIESMVDEGHDVIENVAALCPNCHARAHYASDRRKVQERLLNVIHLANERFLLLIGEGS